MCLPRAAVLAAVAAACGDNLIPVGPPLAPADSLFVVAHFDDDILFMQPELVDAVSTGSSTTVFVLSGDPVFGQDRAQEVFEAAMLGYERVAGASDWACGYIDVTGLPVHHCRLRDRPVSMLALDVPDGGRYDEHTSLLELVEGSVSSLQLIGPRRARVTVASLVDELAAIIAATAPRELHTLDRAATHGDDHRGHLFTASFALWGAASAGYTGAIVAHRGYNVDGEPPTLSEADYARARPMVAYFEACYFECAPCGTPCATLQESHEAWLRRQYASIAPAAHAGVRLEAAATAGACLARIDDGSIGLAGCTGAPALQLDGDRHLRAGGMCVTAGDGNDEPLAVAPCAADPAQYWLLDDEGFVWNGRPPAAAADMSFDHVRCLRGEPTALAGAPICGNRLRPRWRALP